MRRAHAAAADYRVKRRSGCLESGDQDPAAVIAGAEKGHAGLPRRYYHGYRRQHHRPLRQYVWRLRCRAGILQQNPQRRLLRGKQVVSLARAVKRKAVADERFDVQLARGHKVQHGLEIALLCPAHEADRIILSPLFVSRVIAAWPVRARHLKGQFLFVKVGPRELEPRYAHQHDAPALAAHLRGLADRLVALGRCGDDYRIHAAPARKRRRCG